MPSPSPRRRCALTAPFHPYRAVRASAVCFLLHCPASCLDWPLASTLPFEARTFLPCFAFATHRRSPRSLRRVGGSLIPDSFGEQKGRRVSSTSTSTSTISRPRPRKPTIRADDPSRRSEHAHDPRPRPRSTPTPTPHAHDPRPRARPRLHLRLRHAPRPGTPTNDPSPRPRVRVGRRIEVWARVGQWRRLTGGVALPASSPYPRTRTRTRSSSISCCLLPTCVPEAHRSVSLRRPPTIRRQQGADYRLRCGGSSGSSSPRGRP